VKVAFDATPLVQTRAGTARHVRGLLEALGSRPGLELRRLTFGGAGKLSTVLRDAIWYPVGTALAARGADVLHCTTFRGPLRSRVPVVLTIHDLAILRFSATLPRWHRFYGRAGLRSVARSADVVLALSEFTRREIVELLPVPAERVRVVANGVDPVFRPDGPAAGGDYVLAVGSLEPRKNLDRAAAAARLAGLELRVVGPVGWGGVKASGWVGFVGDDELARLYRGARCLVYASLYEGFGIPVLEAMASGTPVVTSRDGATAEVAGGAAVLVDPLDPEAIAAGIEEADRRRGDLVPRGLARAGEFTWERAGDSVAAVWRELLA
jgi:glycosyltransferase involved in cell wall biosynthesis